jgi:outer membrane protein assembly factor BamA
MLHDFTRSPLLLIGLFLIFPAFADALPVKSMTIVGTRFPVTLATQAGRPCDARAVASDVHKLWATGRFDDIQVESRDDADGSTIVFRMRESRHLQLREIHIEPNSLGLHPKIAAGTPINLLRAYEIAMEAQKRLNAEGYLHAKVDTTLVPVSPGKVDLPLAVHAGQPVDLKSVEFQGDRGLRVRELRSALRAMRSHRRIRGCGSNRSVDAASRT